MEDNVLESVMEHHTDMLLVEELKCDPDFSRWFAEHCDVRPEPVTFAKNSVWDSTRESDVMVQFGGTDGNVVLVENKVTAPLSPDQARDYHRRGKALVSEGKCSAYRTCIMAPAAWFAAHEEHGFDVCVSYEDLAKAIAGTDSNRSRWRAGVFRQGALRAQKKLTYSNEQIGIFLRDYYAFAQTHYPALNTKRSTGQKSTTVVFPLSLGKAFDLGRYVDVEHSFSERVVKLTIGWSDAQAVQFALSEAESPMGWNITQNGGRVDVSCKVPEIDVNVAVAQQQPQLKDALESACQMAEFVRANADVLRKIPDTRVQRPTV